MGAAAAPTSYRIGAKPIRSTRHNPELGIRPVKSRYRKMTADVRTTRHILLCRAVFHVRVAPKEKFSIAPAPKAVQPAFRLVPSLSSSRQRDIGPAIHPSRPPEEGFRASETPALFL